MFNADARPIEQMGITAGKQHIETRIATKAVSLVENRAFTTPIIPAEALLLGSGGHPLNRPKVNGPLPHAHIPVGLECLP